MKHTIIHKFDGTMLCLLWGLAVCVAPTLAQKSPASFSGYPTWGQGERLWWQMLQTVNGQLKNNLRDSQ